MQFYAVIKENKNVERVFGWGDSRELPTDYPKPEGSTIIKIPEKFAQILQTNWITKTYTIKDPTVILDSTKNYAEYFIESDREQEVAVDPIKDLKEQNAQLVLTLVEKGVI